MPSEFSTTSHDLDDLIKQALVALPIGLPISTREVVEAIRSAGADMTASDAEIVDKIVHLASGWTMAVEFDHAA
jgi:hypothetical protein